MSTITREQAKDLRNAFQCWQQYYDPVEDKEQYDMFGLGMVAMDALLASLEAEPLCYLTWHQGFRAPDDCEEYVVEAKPGDKSCDGSPAFPVYTAPPAPVSVPAGYRLQPISEYDAMCAAMLQGAEPVTTAYKLTNEIGSSLQLRNLIRQRHAEWSQATFGDVGPVGPLKHLSKEALEAAAEPNDLSEWADMQFLLWDAQRRAGISDGEITAAMEEKLKVNMARQWPEPKDGEPRLHIKTAPQQEVK